MPVIQDFIFKCFFWVRWYATIALSFLVMGFSCGSDGIESACIAGDLGWIPDLGRSTGGRHGSPLQYSCLENPHGQRSLVGYGSPWGSQWVRHYWEINTFINYDFVPKILSISSSLYSAINKAIKTGFKFSKIWKFSKTTLFWISDNAYIHYMSMIQNIFSRTTTHICTWVWLQCLAFLNCLSSWPVHSSRSRLNNQDRE